MHIDWTLNIGTILSIVVIVILAIWKFHRATIDKMDAAIKTLTRKSEDIDRRLVVVETKTGVRGGAHVAMIRSDG